MNKKTLSLLLGIMVIITMSACSILDTIKSKIGMGGTTGTDSNVLFEDDFSSNSAGWDEYSDSDGSTSVTDGTYEIIVNTENLDIWGNPGLNFGDVSIEVDATKVAGPDDNDFGVLCRYQDSSNYYFSYLASDGYYAVGKLENGEFVTLSGDSMPATDAVNSGSVMNHIRFDCVGSTLSLYANGTLLGTYEDTSFTTGDIGLIAGTFTTTGTDIQFDNLVVSKP